MDPRALLTRLLEGDALTAADLTSLLAARLEEGQCLDYKRGKWFEHSTKKPGERLRQIVSAFANAEGGLVLIGVAGAEGAYDDFTITGCKALEDKKEPVEWLQDLLQPIGAQLLPFPRIGALEVDGKTVGWVAVDRAPSLVHVPEGNSMGTYLRMGHSKQRVPPFLLHDLALGRRQRPELRLGCEFELVQKGTGGNYAVVEMRVSIVNAGISWASRGRLEVVGYCHEGTAEKRSVPIPDPLRRYIRQLPVRPMNRDAAVAACIRGPLREPHDVPPLPALSEHTLEVHVHMPPIESQAWRGGIVLTGASYPPSLWPIQLTLIDGRALQEPRCLPAADRFAIGFGGRDDAAEWDQ